MKEKADRLRFGRFFYRFENGESSADVLDRLTVFEDHVSDERCFSRTDSTAYTGCIVYGMQRVAAFWYVRRGPCVTSSEGGCPSHRAFAFASTLCSLTTHDRVVVAAFATCPLPVLHPLRPQHTQLIRDINAGRFGGGTNLVLVTHGLALRIFLMRWFHWTVDELLRVYNPPNAEVSTLLQVNEHSAPR
jgi:hypothetical protein